MYQKILSGNAAAAGVRMVGRLTNFKPDGFIFLITAGGSDHALGEFDKVIVDATFRNSKGNDINVMSNARLGDLLKMSDYIGGFSTKLKGAAAGQYVAYVPVGKLMLVGDDAVELSVSFPGHATATYALRVTAVDVSQGAETVRGYESLTGAGQEVFIKDVATAYLMSAADGSTYPWVDQEQSLIPEDYDIIALANAIGRMESYENVGIIYEDRSKLTQDLRLKIPAGKNVLFVKQFFPVERVEFSGKQTQFDVSKVVQSVKISNPEKSRYLELTGVIRD
jgi:hypothetical protein